MGKLIEGVWHQDDPSRSEREEGGDAFDRPESSFRHWITPDGEKGPSGEGGFAAAPGRYHLYISHACPWAHRVHIFLKLKKLEGILSHSVVHWFMGDEGWSFEPAEGVIPDSVNGAEFLHQIYTAADPACTSRVTVPVLWDKDRSTIVNNESSEIIRMLNSAFDGVGAAPGDYYPAEWREEIDAVNDRVYETVNNGVYKAGFATSQSAYEDAVFPLFETLDWLEDRLGGREWLVGGVVTEADWRLFTTLIRFDAVYHFHFKCNLRRIRDFPKLWAHTKRLHAWPGIAETVELDHIKGHYYSSHPGINPSRVIPVGPAISFD